jgi:hypothetical protein
LGTCIHFFLIFLLNGKTSFFYFEIQK